MSEELDMTIDIANEAMDDSVEHLKKELSSVRAGKASPSMLSNIYVDSYGVKSPINQVANINVVDGRTLAIKPWDKSMVPIIEKSIFASKLGITPQNDGEIIRLTIPALTEERRRDIAKQIKAMGENAKIGIRKARQEANSAIKQLTKDGLSEDVGKDGEQTIQNTTKKHGSFVDKLIAAKEKEIMSM